MTEIAAFLINNYYKKYKKVTAPSLSVLENAIEINKDRIVIVRDDKIKGVAVYLTLSDKTHDILHNIDIANADAKKLFEEHGKNIHFIILAADCLSTILKGMKKVISKEHPKTISWFNPSNTELHTRRL